MLTVTGEPLTVERIVWLDPTATIAALEEEHALELVTRDIDVPRRYDGEPSIGMTMPLHDWLLIQASWYRQLETEVADLVADTIEIAAQAAVFYRAATPRVLVQRSARYRRHINLDQVAVPVERRTRLAELLEGEAADWLIHDNDAHRLVAAVLLQRADEAHALKARTVADYCELKAAFEAACMDVMTD